MALVTSGNGACRGQGGQGFGGEGMSSAPLGLEDMCLEGSGGPRSWGGTLCVSSVGSVSDCAREQE